MVDYFSVLSCWVKEGSWIPRCGGWHIDGFHMVCHDVLSLEAPFSCVILVLLWYIWGLHYLLMCYVKHEFYVIWDEVGQTLRWSSWCVSWSEFHVPL